MYKIEIACSNLLICAGTHIIHIYTIVLTVINLIENNVAIICDIICGKFILDYSFGRTTIKSDTAQIIVLIHVKKIYVVA